MEKQKNIVDMKSTINQLNIIKIYSNYTQQQDTNSIQVPVKMRPWNMSINIKKSAKISCSKGNEIIQSLFSYHCGILLEIM